jgi:hypothetical protein
MAAEDVLRLRIQLPGLVDYSKQLQRSSYDPALVSCFAEGVNTKGHLVETTRAMAPDQVLRFLDLYERQAARILFGRASYRVIRYSNSDEPTSNEKCYGLLSILLSHFIDDLAGQHEQRYSHRPLKEALANAVAHAAYFELVSLWRVALGSVCKFIKLLFLPRYSR